MGGVKKKFLYSEVNQGGNQNFHFLHWFLFPKIWSPYLVVNLIQFEHCHDFQLLRNQLRFSTPVILKRNFRFI